MIVALLVLIACVLLFGAARTLGAISSFLAFVAVIVILAAAVTFIGMTFGFDLSSLTYLDVAPYLIGFLLILAAVHFFFGDRFDR